MQTCRECPLGRNALNDELGRQPPASRKGADDVQPPRCSTTAAPRLRFWEWPATGHAAQQCRSQQGPAYQPLPRRCGGKQKLTNEGMEVPIGPSRWLSLPKAAGADLCRMYATTPKQDLLESRSQSDLYCWAAKTVGSRSMPIGTPPLALPAIYAQGDVGNVARALIRPSYKRVPMVVNHVQGKHTAIRSLS